MLLLAQDGKDPTYSFPRRVRVRRDRIRCRIRHSDDIAQLGADRSQSRYEVWLDARILRQATWASVSKNGLPGNRCSLPRITCRSISFDARRIQLSESWKASVAV